MKFEESFYTYRYQRMPAEALLAEYQAFQQRDEKATARVAEIEYHLAQGNEYFHRRRYYDALREYKIAEGLMYQLVEPTFDHRAALGRDVLLSVNSRLFNPIMETVLTVIERTPDTVPPVVVGPPNPIDPVVSGSLGAYRDLGIQTRTTIPGAPPDVNRLIGLGDEYVRAGQPDRAIEFYTQALNQVGETDQSGVRAGVLHNLGVAYGEAGQPDKAVEQMEQARQEYARMGNAVAEGAVHENIAALHTRAGRYGQALQSLNTAEQLYATAAGQSAGAAAGLTRAIAPPPSFTPHDLNNAGVRLAQQRNALQSLDQRGTFLGRVMNRIQRGIEPKAVPAPALTLQPLPREAAGPAARALPDMGGVSGAPVAEAKMLRIATGIEPEQDSMRLRVVEVSLQDSNRAAIMQQQVYQQRIGVKNLDALGIGIGAAYLPDYFRAHIPHHYFFTIQMCLGDTYLALGQYALALERYVRARGYQYLNLALEAPTVWIRIARCLLAWGYDLYRDNQIVPALEKFQQILVVSLGGERTLPAASPLYHQAPFNDIQNKVQAFITTMDDEAPAELNPDMEIIVRQARVYEEMIHAGLNVLGLPLDLIPIFRFRYLQAVARYFAEQAIKAERDYINFKSTSEQETASLMQLQQAEDLAKEGVELEKRRVEEAVTEQDLAAKSRDLAQERVDNATERRDQYVTVSADKVVLDTASAHASGGFTETEGGYQVNLSSTGETVNLGDKDYEILRNAAWHRGMIQRQFDLDDMQRTIDEYNANLDVANAQVTLANKRKAVADQNQIIAHVRLTQAKANREFAENKTFNAELWSNLADRMREISQLYLDRAIEIALYMQAAYNFEMDTSLNKIGTHYTTGSELGGLLGGDALLADINYFTYHYITQSKSKEVPCKSIISLAERYPFVLLQFRQTGVAHFETKLDDFDRLYPGTYMHKIRAVEVAVEGLISADGVIGNLKNSGISTFRTRDNHVKVRLQPRETMLLSSFSLKGDAVVFRPSEETLGVFEGSGVATAWTLEIPVESNDLNYQSISDIKLVLYYDAYHDPLLEAAIRQSLPGTGQWSRGFSLRFNYPDAFFLLIERATTDFEIQVRDFPYNHLNVQVQRLAVYVIAEAGFPAAGVKLVLTNETAELSAAVTTGADGTVTSDPADATAALNVFHDHSPLGHWTVALDPEANPELFREEPAGSGVMRVQGVRDIVLVMDYEYDVRGAEPV
jgi:tetratricopeptide (TPR) repeat protein